MLLVTMICSEERIVSESEEVVFTVKNANIEAMMKALEEGHEDQFRMVNLVTTLLAGHEELVKPFREKYGFDPSLVFVKEGILTNHAQLVNDGRQGVFALKLLRLAQQGRLIFKYTPHNLRAALMFETR
ncbi:hypothetical protein [Aeromonas salmonicida]|uniref:hypothetical protein n=1 Tax=Aeromonas salmonicida TaxID=645 RepID=UPI0012FA2C3D|nr:hypothetical protein [Aeromonas salmonicida]